MRIDPKDFLVKPGTKVKLEKWPTYVKPTYRSKEHYQQILSEHIDELSSLQNLLYAHNRYSVLLILQSMDAAGKDSVIKHVMSGVNPQGCQVFSFKHPSMEELKHDFLWREIRSLPERGMIGIFNRSYYEEVLIARVHPEILQSQNIPHEFLDKQAIWEGRYQSMTNLEAHLYRNGTRIIKFFLHLSKEEQRKRFLKRIDDPKKNWKFSMADMNERKFWSEYMEAYEACLGATSSTNAPWYIIPADDKDNTHLIVSQIILNMLKGLKMSYPKPSTARKKELESIRKLLK